MIYFFYNIRLYSLSLSLFFYFKIFSLIIFFVFSIEQRIPSLYLKLLLKRRLINIDLELFFFYLMVFVVILQKKVLRRFIYLFRFVSLFLEIIRWFYRDAYNRLWLVYIYLCIIFSELKYIFSKIYENKKKYFWLFKLFKIFFSSLFY